jgi:hypothetical protein
MAQKVKLRTELLDAGIRYTYPRVIGAFDYQGKTLNLKTCTVRRALLAAKDENCKVLGFEEPKKTTSKTEKK